MQDQKRKQTHVRRAPARPQRRTRYTPTPAYRSVWQEYEARKQKLPVLSATQYQDECRRIAKELGL